MESHPFGERIRRKRLALLADDPRYSLRRLAARLGIQPSYLSRLERGAVSGLSEKNILALAEELGENPDALLALAGKIAPDVREVLLARPEAFASLIRRLAVLPDAERDVCGDTDALLTSFRETQRLGRVGSFSRNLVTGEAFWSEECLRIFGLPPNGPSPSYADFLALVHPEDRGKVEAARKQLQAKGCQLHYNYRFRRADGLWRHAKSVARSEADATGRVVRYHGTVQDVTSERQAQEHLRSMARFPESNPFPVMRVGRGGHLSYANAASAPLLDSLGMAVGRPVTAELAASVAKARETGVRQDLDVSVGERIFAIAMSPSSVWGEVNCYGRDVTEERRVAAGAGNDERCCRQLFDAAPIGIFRATTSGRLLAANPAMAAMFGYASPEDMYAHLGHNAGLGYRDPKRRDEIVRRLSRDGTIGSFENPYLRKDGTEFIGNLHARLAVSEEGEPVVEGFVEDATARKQAQRELAAREERLQNHLRNFPLPTLTFRLRDRELVLLSANKAAEALFKGRIGSCLEAPAGAIFDEAPEVYLALWSALESRTTESRQLLFRPPGATEPGLFAMTFVAAGPDTVMLHAEEITALARTREALRRVNDQLRGLLDHVPCAVYFKDPQGRCIMVNRAVEELFGRPAEDIVGHPPGRVHDSEVAARISEDDRQVMETGQAITVEEEIIAQGRTRTFLTTKAPLRDASGQPCGLCGMSLDITAVKTLEHDLKAERDTLASVLAYVPYAARLVGADGRTLFLNQRFIDLLGYDLQDIPDADAWMRKAYPDPELRAKVRADWQQSLGTNCRRVYPVRCADGTTLSLDFDVVALPDGRMLLTMSQIEDGDDRKEKPA
ncbi:transcriptional regulator, XRE family [Solidesulfovibrio fructosivorans JJ]]|uniref:histidine kinase n=1 Tax=Solidesulfovibrio fructosivorans JJ] TaxID=596151 RepID=E1JZ40_SOLFR|nr:PAS domain S-box protein [Solidesulfovibrio fructosivorans]EFL50323.1 transcriptional regulator, XRE family [Solidesulfovibrio fructosivorans JJ]]